MCRSSVCAKATIRCPPASHSGREAGLAKTQMNRVPYGSHTRMVAGFARICCGPPCAAFSLLGVLVFRSPRIPPPKAAAHDAMAWIGDKSSPDGVKFPSKSTLPRRSVSISKRHRFHFFDLPAEEVSERACRAGVGIRGDGCRLSRRAYVDPSLFSAPASRRRSVAWSGAPAHASIAGRRPGFGRRARSTPGRSARESPRQPGGPHQ